MSKDEMLIRGIKGGVLIVLPRGHWFQQRDALITRIQTQERFFKGGRIAIDVGETAWSEDQLVMLLKDLSDEGVCLWAVISTAEQTLDSARSFGISTTTTVEESQGPVGKADQSIRINQAHWIRSTLEVAEKLVVEGDAVITGDIPKDAEIIASGSLLLWGCLYGTIRAGCRGAEDARIFVLRFAEGEIFLAGEWVEITRKMRDSTQIEIFRKDGEIQVLASHQKKFKLL
jgi:septum formation inhibitor MinC